MKGLVFKETVVPCVWGSETWEFGMKQIDMSQVSSVIR